MVRAFLGSLLLGAATAASAQPTPASISTKPVAQSLFERDWVLMNWALKLYDADRDIMLQPAEPAAAASAFRTMADINKDGRVTPDEYRAAREAILQGG
jgi:hypothetical protein